MVYPAMSAGEMVRALAHRLPHCRWPVAIASLGLLCLIACATTPPVPVIPAWNQLAGAPVAIDPDERKLWDEAKDFRETLEKKDIIFSDAEVTAYLNGVLARLMTDPLPEQAPRPTIWVIRSAERNALAQPDGAILITTSMLAALDNEAQLAALMGHELGHFMARHGLLEKRFEHKSRSMAVRMQVSRNMEEYCDRFALDLMQRAGYDPRQTLRVLQISEAEEETQNGPYKFRSHPFVRERLRAMQHAIRISPDGTADKRVDTERYERGIVKLLPVAAEVELRARLTDRAAATIARLLALQPNSGRAFYLKGELIRLTAPEGRNAAAARAAYERAVELAPDDPDAVRALGFLYRSDGDFTRARPLLERYLQLSPAAADRKLVERYLSGGSNAPRVAAP